MPRASGQQGENFDWYPKKENKKRGKNELHSLSVGSISTYTGGGACGVHSTYLIERIVTPYILIYLPL